MMTAPTKKAVSKLAAAFSAHPWLTALGAVLVTTSVAAAIIAGDRGPAGVRPTSAEVATTDDTVYLQSNPAGDGPVPLTADECNELRPLMEAGAASLRAETLRGNPGALAQVDGTIARSRAWMDAGCPPHPVMGSYPFKDGTGREIKFFDQSSFTSR